MSNYVNSTGGVFDTILIGGGVNLKPVTVTPTLSSFCITYSTTPCQIDYMKLMDNFYFVEIRGILIMHKQDFAQYDELITNTNLPFQPENSYFFTMYDHTDNLMIMVELTENKIYICNTHKFSSSKNNWCRLDSGFLIKVKT